MAQWRVARDSSVIAQAIQRDLLAPYLAQTFPGQKVAVKFGFDFTVPPTPKEVFEVAAVAKSAGISIDLAQLEEQTGYTLTKDEPAPQPGGFGGMPMLNKENYPTPAGQTQAAGQRSPGKDQGEDASNVLAAFAKDTGPAADAIRKLLEDPTPEKAAALMKDLPNLIPEDPAMAAVIAEEMAKEFGSVSAANKTDGNGMEHAEKGEAGGGQFVSKDGESSGTTPKDDVDNSSQDRKEEDPSKDSEENVLDELKRRTPEQNAEFGKDAIRTAMDTKSDVLNAMYRETTGAIDFIWGSEGTAEKNNEDGMGIAHIKKKHNKDLYRIPGIIAHGAVYKHPYHSNRLSIIKGRTLVVLERNDKGSFLITGFEPDKPSKYLARFRAQEMLEGEK